MATAVPFDFGKDIYVPVKLINGFSGAETSHRWTDGAQAELVVSQNGFMQSILFIDLQAFGIRTPLWIHTKRVKDQHEV